MWSIAQKNNRALNTYRRKIRKERKETMSYNSMDYWKLLKSKNDKEEPGISITCIFISVIWDFHF